MRVCLDDAQAVGLVTCDAFLTRLQAHDGTVWTAEQLLRPPPSPCVGVKACARAPAYVIYLGFRQQTKGIAINQGSICHFLRSGTRFLA